MAGPSAIRGKVVLVPFPFDDLSGSKVRPAVCLTDPVGPPRPVVPAFVTSQVEPGRNAAGGRRFAAATAIRLGLSRLRPDSVCRQHHRRFAEARSSSTENEK